MSEFNNENNGFFAKFSAFFKLKGRMIGKLFIYQIAMSLFGLFVISPFNGGMQFFASVFSALFYFSLVCYAVIEDGQKDFVSSSAGRLNGNPLSGFYYALIAYIPTIVIVLSSVILSFAVDPFTPSVAVTIRDLLNILIRFFLMGMYLGFDTGLVVRQYDLLTGKYAILSGENLLFLSDHYLIFAICLILIPLICGITYYLAFKGKIHVDTTQKEKKNKKKDKND